MGGRTQSRKITQLGSEEQARGAGLLFAQQVLSAHLKPSWCLSYLKFPIAFHLLKHSFSYQILKRRPPFPRCSSRCLSSHSLVIFFAAILVRWCGRGSQTRQPFRMSVILILPIRRLRWLWIWSRICCALFKESLVMDGSPAPRWHLERGLESPGKVLHHTWGLSRLECSCRIRNQV